MSTNKTKSDLLGEVTHTHKSMHVVDMAILKTPLGEKSVMHAFCTGCGNYPEFSKGAYDYLVEKENSEVPDPEKMYVSMNHCINCYNEESGFDVKIEIVPM